MNGERDMMKEREKNNNSNRKKEMMTKVELKNMHSNDLRNLKKRIQEELNFREDIGKEIENNNNIKSSRENQSYGQRKVNDS